MASGSARWGHRGGGFGLGWVLCAVQLWSLDQGRLRADAEWPRGLLRRRDSILWRNPVRRCGVDLRPVFRLSMDRPVRGIEESITVTVANRSDRRSLGA